MSDKVFFRIGWTCRCVATSLPWVEIDMIRRGIIRESIDLFQLGYRTNVAASAGTHGKGGNTDVAQRSPEAIQVWREWGWTMQDRSPWFPDDQHAHGWPWGCTHLADAAQYQIDDWKNRKNGLANHGPVKGMWPVKKWDDALEEMVRKMYTLDDIAEAVLKKDGVIPNNGFASSAAGDFVSLATAMKGVGERLRKMWTPAQVAAEVTRQQAEQNAKTQAQLDGLSNRLDALIAALPPAPPQP